MKVGTSKLVMGATLVVVVSLAIVLALVLVLLAELYCSMLLRKRRFRTTASTATATTAATSPQPSQYSSSSAPLSSVYAQGVLLAAPRSFLFPSIDVNKQQGKQVKEENQNQNQNQNQQYPKSDQVLEILTQDPINKNIDHIGFISALSPTPSSVSLSASPLHQQPIHQEVGFEVTNHTSTVVVGGDHEHLVYISNPIYDNDISCRQGRGVVVGGGGGIGTPFETPGSSPSNLEMEDGCWYGGEEDEEQSESSSSPSSVMTMTPPLTPMKKLPPMEASCSSVSVSLRDVGTSGSDSNGNNNNNGLLSSSSGSPSTSPSW